MSYCKPLLITCDASCPDKYIAYKAQRLQRIPKPIENSPSPKTQTPPGSDLTPHEKAILERTATLIRAERFKGEIMAEFMQYEEKILSDEIDILFGRRSDENDMDFAKRLIHFRSSYLISYGCLINSIKDPQEDKVSLRTHLNSYVSMRSAALGNDPDFEIQSRKGIWEFMSTHSPLLPPELFLKASQITFLDLDTSNIVELPAEIEKCVNLGYLNLSDTFIKELPPQIGKLKVLTYLNISGCRYLSKLPNEIIHLTNLRRLIFVWTAGPDNHNFQDCYKNHKCALDICIFFFQDLTLSQQRWLRELKFNSCFIDGLHIGQVPKKKKRRALS